MGERLEDGGIVWWFGKGVDWEREMVWMSVGGID
jgi:hypothetical protein